MLFFTPLHVFYRCSLHVKYVKFPVLRADLFLQLYTVKNALHWPLRGFTVKYMAHEQFYSALAGRVDETIVKMPQSQEHPRDGADPISLEVALADISREDGQRAPCASFSKVYVDCGARHGSLLRLASGGYRCPYWTLIEFSC